MLLLVARQQSVSMKSLTRNYVTGFLWFRAVTIAMQRLDKRTLNDKATVLHGVAAEGLSWRQLEWPKQTRVEAGSNTSTVTLRVVGGDEKGSLKFETVKYGREY
jgi:hypothetical protein